MRFVLTSAIKDLRRRLTDPAALLMWMGLPIVIGALMSLISGGNGPAPKAHLLVVDEDQSLLSRLMIGGSRQGQLAEFLDVEIVTAEAGRVKIDKGDASALLTIPKGFRRQRPARAAGHACARDQSGAADPAGHHRGRLEDARRSGVLRAASLRRAASRDCPSLGTATGPSSDGVAAVSRAFNDRLQALQGTLLPPVLSLNVKMPAQEDEPNFWALFLPGLLFMSLMFTAQGMSIDIWIEKTGGTLRRLLSTPQRVASFLMGKLVASVAIMALAVSVALLLGVMTFGVPPSRAPLALAWAAYAGGALFCYLVLIQLFATSARGGSSSRRWSCFRSS